MPIKPTKTCQIGLKDLLRNGKRTLENLIKPIDTKYECTIMRAGGFNICPSSDILSAMRDVGLRADSSVFSGGFSQTNYQHYDYRKIPNIYNYRLR